MIPTTPLIKIFYKKMFLSEPVRIKNKEIPIKVKAGLRRYDVGNILFIEQNPKAKTVWATKAKEGAKILWIIDTKWNKYLYRVVDGKITKLKNNKKYG